MCVVVARGHLLWGDELRDLMKENEIDLGFSLDSEKRSTASGSARNRTEDRGQCSSTGGSRRAQPPAETR